MAFVPKHGGLSDIAFLMGASAGAAEMRCTKARRAKETRDCTGRVMVRERGNGS